MNKKDVIVLKYKMYKLKPKSGEEEPNWKEMEIDPKSIKHKFNTELVWAKKTFEKEGVISIEEIDENTSAINHEEGTFIVQKKFKKLFNLIYK